MRVFELLDYTPNVAHIKFLVKGRDASGVIDDGGLAAGQGVGVSRMARFAWR